MGLLAVSVGLPFAALSASAPLLQGWFAASGHPKAGNPYVLYAASNLGSFAALIAYPVVVEPMLPLADQSRLWSVGFAAFALLVAAASLFVANRPGIVAADAVGRAGLDARSPDLDRAGGHSVRARHRGDVVYQHRRRGRAVPLDGAARALPAHLRGGVPRPAVDPAVHGRHAGADPDGAARDRAPRRRRQAVLARHDRRQPGGVPAARAAVPPRALRAAAGAGAAHRILPVGLVRRRRSAASSPR